MSGVSLLEIEVVQRRPCRPNIGACMDIETTRASALHLPTQHVCDDARAAKSKRAIIEIVAEARRGGFEGEVTAQFPPATLGLHVLDSRGRLVPQVNERPHK
jgi:hypothetical protein